MSKTVDERVVEMRFDNRQFESNVQTSMSTLEKLKRSLNFGNSAKGLEGLGTAAKNVNFSGMSNGIETVHAKFSALQVMGITALTRITNQAMNAGERIAKSLTIDPIKTGLQEYETQINSVQTILANTQKEGTTVKDVNAALDELNKYADLTIYNFTEMTRNIGTFTAAGVKLDTSVNAIQGIANLAAVSGSTSQQASTAMYQLSQALAAGTVKLMDWNSVVNAGMGGQVFQDALKETSELLGTGAEAAIKAEGSFRESLSTGWLTSEVLTETLKKFTTSGAKEYVAEYTGLSAEAVQSALDAAKAQYGEADAIEYASKALAEKSGKNAEEIKSALQFAKTAEDAATKVKTFTQLWDVLKEAAQSGWAQTWRLIIGDFEEAKSFFSDIAKPLTAMIDKMSDARNKLLASALGKGFGELSKKFQNVLEPVKKTADSIQDVTKKITDLGVVVDDVIGGKFGNGQKRFDALTKAGYNWCEVQNKVNEKLGCSKRYTVEQAEAQSKLTKQQEESSKSKEKEVESTTKLTDAQKKQIKEMAALYKEKGKNAELTKAQVDALEELDQTARKLGMPLNDLIDNLDEINGRWLLLNSIKNIGRAIGTAFSAIGKAWKETFEAIKPEQLFNAIAAVHKFTSSLILSDSNAEKLTRTFKGLFAILDIISTVLGGGVKLAFKTLTSVLGMFDMNILDLTARIGDAIVKFHDFLFNNKLVNKGLELLSTIIGTVSKKIREFADSFSKLPEVQKFVKGIQKALGELSKKLKLPDNLGSDIVDGLVNGLEKGIDKVTKGITNIAIALIDTFCGLLGIHSPSKVFFDYGVNIIEGLINGLKSLTGKACDGIAFLADKISEVFKNFNFDINLDGLKAFIENFKGLIQQIDLKKIVAMIPVAVTLLVGKRFYDLIKVFSDGIKGINGVIEGFEGVLKSLSGVFKSMSQNIKAKALKNFAIAIAILVASIVALTMVNQDNLMNAVFTIIVLAGVLIALSAAMKLMESASVSVGKSGVKLSGLKTGLVAIGASILMLAAAVKIMGTMNLEQAKQGFKGLAVLVVAIASVFAAYGLLVKGKAAQNIDKAGVMLLKMSISLLLLAKVTQMLSSLTWPELGKAAAFAAGFVVFVGLLNLVTQKSSKNIDKIGGTMLKLSIALALMVGVCKLIGLLKAEEILSGIVFVGAFAVFVKVLVQVTQIGKEEKIAKLGGLLLSISVSLMLMVGVCKLVGMLKAEDMLAGAVFAGAFLFFIDTLVKVTKIGSEEKIASVAATILAFSIAIGILAGVSILLSMMSLEGLAKGVTAVSILGLVMTQMIKALQGANNVKASLIVMTVAFVLMAGAIAVLSTIDPTRLLGASAALSMVMGMFALVTKYAGVMQTSWKTIALMSTVIVVLAGALRLLAELPIENSVGAAMSLSVLLLSLSAAIKIMGSVAAIAPTAYGALVVMTGVVAVLAGVLTMLQNLPVKTALASAISLSALLIAISTAVTILSGSVTISPKALAAVGVMTLVVGALALILYQIQDLPIASTMINAISLSTLLIALSASIAILSLVGPVATGAIAGIGAMTVLIGAVAGVMLALGQLSEWFPGMEELLNRGLPLLEKIGYGLGSFVGNIIGGLSDGLTSGLPAIATHLSNFMANLQPFIDGAKQLDESMLSGVSSLVKSVMAITGANLLESITAWVTGGSSMESFGTQLVALGKAMTDYSGSVAGVNIESITASASAAKALVLVANTLGNSGGLLATVVGDNSLATFGAQLVPFGKSMQEYSVAVAGLNVEAITASASAARAMVNVANSLGNSGGLISTIIGDNSLATFGFQLVGFGNGMKKYSESVAGINTEAITASASAAKSMVKVANSLGNSGGLISKIMGDNSLSSFGQQLVPFGKSMKSYAASVTGLNAEAVSASVPAAKAMVKVANSLPKEGGLAGLFKGKTDTSAFSGMTSLGKSMKSYSVAVAGISVEAISNSASAIKKMVSAINSTANVNASGVKSFQSAVSTLAKTNLSGITKTFSSSASQMASAGANISKSLASGLKSNSASVSSAATSMMNSMRSAISGSSGSFGAVGRDLVVKFAAGIKSQSSTVSSAMSSLVTSASSRIRSNYSSMQSAGTHLGSGLIIGINSKKTAAYNAGYALGKAAVQGEKDGQKSKSPSRLTMQAGRWLGEGLVIGMEQMGKSVYKAGYNMGDSAANSMSNAISTMSTLLDGGIDTEPSIRPVLDLSDIKAGMGSIDGMMNQRYALAAGVDIQSTAALMSRHNQNGGMDEVVSAINGLQRMIGKTGNTTNIIEGITYDDGSNLNNAVESIVRAARMGRRV